MESGCHLMSEQTFLWRPALVPGPARAPGVRWKVQILRREEAEHRTRYPPAKSCSRLRVSQGLRSPRSVNWERFRASVRGQGASSWLSGLDSELTRNAAHDAADPQGGVLGHAAAQVARARGGAADPGFVFPWLGTQQEAHGHAIC